MPSVPNSTAGRLLVATPAIGDGTFDQSVIFMLHHDADGALGVVINESTELAIEELLPRWADLSWTPGLVLAGGPVEPNGFIGLGRLVRATAPVHSGTEDADGDDAPIVAPVHGTGLATIDLDADPALMAAEIDRLRIFRGYAGWGPLQLDTELSAGAWFDVPAQGDDLWAADPSELYQSVLRRQSGRLRWFANAPRDPSLN